MDTTQIKFAIYWDHFLGRRKTALHKVGIITIFPLKFVTATFQELLIVPCEEPPFEFHIPLKKNSLFKVKTIFSFFEK